MPPKKNRDLKEAEIEGEEELIKKVEKFNTIEE